MPKLLFILFTLGILFFIFRPTPTPYAITNAHPQGKAIIAFGDSLSYGTGAENGMDYPAQLSRMLNIPVINQGIPGDTTAMALNRIDTILKQRPRIVMITLGGNDILRKIPKSTAFTNLKTITDRLQRTGALVIIGGLDLPMFGHGFVQGYRDLAEKTGSVLVPNIYQGIMGNPELMSDPIHPNSRGYTKMARHFFEALQPYVYPPIPNTKMPQ